MSEDKRIDRRSLIKGALGVGAGTALFHVVPASALGLGGHTAPSNRIVMGCIGLGGQGSGNMGTFLNMPDTQIVAVCDVDKNHLAGAKRTVDQHNNNTSCAAYGDFRELLSRKDMDAISLATPDHWHAIPAITALNAGLDVYGEKPVSHCLAEGRAMADAQKKNNRIWQTGSWQRSESHFRTACELVRNGRIGKVTKIEVGLPTGSPRGPVTFKDPPPELDYEFWVGPSRMAPYCDERTHWNWRWQLDYGGGQMMDWIGHHADIANWGMGWDSTGPIQIEGKGEYPTEGIWNAATTYHFIGTYPGGVEMHVANGGNAGIRGGTKWYGENGKWIWVDRGGFKGGLEASSPSILEEKVGPNENQLFRSPGHWREFLDSVKSRRQTLCPLETGHRAASIGHLGQIAMLTGRKLHWNPDTEQFKDDSTATRMLSTPMRAPWHV
ncbi:MAG: iolG 4 [Chthonomonadales bacterium]|nr:iolG 4 [Chthonomonadales bacterium]